MIKRAFSAGFAFFYFITVPAAPLLAQPLEDNGAASEAHEQVSEVSLQSFEPGLSETGAFPAQDGLVVPADGIAPENFGALTFPEASDRPEDEPASDSSLQGSNQAPRDAAGPDSHKRLEKIAGESEKLSNANTGSPEEKKNQADFSAGSGRPAAIDLSGWERSLPAESRFPGMEKFPNFYRAFVEDLNSRFASAPYHSDREAFLQAVKQNRFHAKLAGVGELETKFISGQAAVRFVPENDEASPLVMLWVNVPLTVNAGVPSIALESNHHLAVYGSRVLIDRRIEFKRLLKDGSWGTPHRSFLAVDHAGGTIAGSAFSPALNRVDSQWFRHWFNGTFEAPTYRDVFRGVVSSSIQFVLGYRGAILAQKIHPVAHPFIFWPALVGGLFSLLWAVQSDTYNTLVKRGENAQWDSFKRLAIGAVMMGFPIALMQSYAAGRLTMTHFFMEVIPSVVLIGWGDRRVSTVMNVVPNIHLKYSMKPWFFPERVETPGGETLARMTGKESFRETAKGVTWTREVIAIARFAVKFPGLFLDPILKPYTHGVPVFTALLWVSSIPFSIFNYYAVKKLVAENPRIQEDFELMQKSYPKFVRRWLSRD